MKFIGRNTEYIEIVDLNESNANILNESRQSELSLVWFKSDKNDINIDAIDYIFNTNNIISLTEFHSIKVNKLAGACLLYTSPSPRDA